ncbi:hypothetical protein B7486_70360, partial [cyanobacterium TDX16]
DVTIAGGRGVGVGAGSGLEAGGLVELERTVVVDNDGSGVTSSAGDIRLEQSTVSDNARAGVDADDDAFVTQSTVSGNGDEGVDSSDETVVVLSTVHGNGDTGVDGLELVVAQSTVTGNEVNLEANDVFLAGSAIGEATSINCDVLTVDSFGGSLVDDTTCDLPTAEETAGSLGLGPLQANGGRTLTRLPSATSGLLDRIVVAACDDLDPEGFDILGEEVDQRGSSR